MPRLAPSNCRIPGCAGIAEERGYCNTHAARRALDPQKRYDDNRPSRQKRGYDRNHYKLRKMKRARNPICEAKGCDKPSTDLHHVDGNPWNREWENLEMLCHECHSSVTNRGMRTN